MSYIIQVFAEISFFDRVFILITTVAVLIQIIYWIRYSFSLKKSFHSKSLDICNIPPVSVIVVVNENHLEWINGEMKELFSQNHPNYEVIAVNDCGGEDVSLALQSLYLENPILKYTTIVLDKKYAHTKKVASLVGIKRASFDNFIFIDPWTKPSSENWLINMSEGFLEGKDVVIGASSMSPRKGQSFIIRCYGLMSTIRFCSAAAHNRPYRASRSNFGFTRKVFFDNGGYNYQKSSYGQNDLFLQKILSKDNYSLVFGDGCQMKLSYMDSFKNWFNDEKFLSSSFKFYPIRVKLSIFIELLSSFVMWVMFVMSVVKMFVILILNDWHFPQNELVQYYATLFLALIFVRQILLLNAVYRFSKKLNMQRMCLGFLFYEKIAPVIEFILSVCRHFGAVKKIW